MLRPYRSLDCLALDTLLAEFGREAPEVVGLSERVFGSLDRLQLYASPAGPAGFAFWPGDEVRYLAGFYVRDGARRAEVLAASIAPLQASGVLALMAPERFGDVHLGPTLADRGFTRIERIDMVQEQARVKAAPLDVPAPYRLIDWESSHEAAAAHLLSASTQGTVDGLFLCFPALPTPTACEGLLHDLRGGRYGEFLPDVSAMVLEGDRLVGLLLATRSGPEEVFLYELALARDVQGRGLAPVLIRRIQAGARAHGLKGVRFMWCDLNRAVRKLFPAETIVTETREPWWIWRSESYRNGRLKRGPVPTGG